MATLTTSTEITGITWAQQQSFLTSLTLVSSPLDFFFFALNRQTAALFKRSKRRSELCEGSFFKAHLLDSKAPEHGTFRKWLKRELKQKVISSHIFTNYSGWKLKYVRLLSGLIWIIQKGHWIYALVQITSELWRNKTYEYPIPCMALAIWELALSANLGKMMVKTRDFLRKW